MPVQTKSGELVQKQGKGTPQGGVISPLLANLFLHYAMDMWLEHTHKFRLSALNPIFQLLRRRLVWWARKR
jgi:retron-type reverse transcriptase